MVTPIYHLYLDDSGTRYPNRPVNRARNDGLDHFALGGLLIGSEDVEITKARVGELIRAYELSGPLHSSSIRTKKGDFTWLERDPERAERFYTDIGNLLCQLPGFATACVVHRPGYNQRYERQYGERRWDLCKSAYPIVVERAAKFARRNGRRLMVYVEQTGKKEDRAIKTYHRDMRANGMYFDAANSGKYNPLGGPDLAAALFAEPAFIKKEHALAQISDLLLFPLVKGRYDPNYRPFRALYDAGRIIDCALPVVEIPRMGVKYYCFDGV